VGWKEARVRGKDRGSRRWFTEVGRRCPSDSRVLCASILKQFPHLWVIHMHTRGQVDMDHASLKALMDEADFSMNGSLDIQEFTFLMTQVFFMSLDDRT